MNENAFPLTHWSAVLEAANADPDRARRAFEQLCGDYRGAIVFWMRLQRLSPEDAEDAAHDFLRQWLQRENPLVGFERGERRFREFLRLCLRRFLTDWRATRIAARRGGRVEHIPWDHDELIEASRETSPPLDLAIAVQIHQCAIDRLKVQWQARLPRDAFDRLQAIALGGGENRGYAALAGELAASVGTIKSWVFRFRRDYHDAFRDAVLRQTDPSDVEDDVIYLHGLLMNPTEQVLKTKFTPLQPQPPTSR